MILVCCSIFSISIYYIFFLVVVLFCHCCCLSCIIIRFECLCAVVGVFLSLFLFCCCYLFSLCYRCPFWLSVHSYVSTSFRMCGRICEGLHLYRRAVFPLGFSAFTGSFAVTFSCSFSFLNTFTSYFCYLLCCYC